VIGVLVLSHYRLADEFVGALRHIVGELPHVRAIGLDPASASPEDMRQQIDKALCDVDTGEACSCW
jgi:PTS system mannose-specific IIA component